MTRMRVKPSKYRAKPQVIDGIRFASQKEARRYAELKLLERAGEIRYLEVQPSFDLVVDDHSVGGKIKRAAALMRAGAGKPAAFPRPVKVGSYRGDFRYQERELRDSENEHWRVVIEDVKGFKTPLYLWKKKHVEAQYGITIREI